MDVSIFNYAGKSVCYIGDNNTITKRKGSSNYLKSYKSVKLPGT